MNEELQHTLSGLAESLGISVGELWSWLQGNGVDAYASAHVAQLRVEVAMLTLAIVVGIAVVVWCLRTHSKKSVEDRWYDGDYAFAAIVAATLTAFPAILLWTAASELAGWMASPEGMIIQMMIERL